MCIQARTAVFRFSVLGIVILSFAGPFARAQATFVEVGSSIGIETYIIAPGHGAGVAAADFDDDGDVDLFVPNERDVPDQLYRNLGNGQFEEIGASAGLASLERSRVAIWVDYDGDGLLDLFVAGDCHQLDSLPNCADSSTLRLYRQTANAQFSDVTSAAGITDDVIVDTAPIRSAITAGDLDNDGWLDLIVGQWPGTSQLFWNDGDGTFTESTNAGPESVNAYHFQPVMLDIDGDGWLDIYYSIDNGPNLLWINQTDRTFVDQATAAGLDNSMSDMGVSFGDYDNDGDFDVYVTNIDNDFHHNVLLRNDSTTGLAFSEISETLNVDDGGWGWGTTLFDSNNDGWLDIGATNGFGSPLYSDDRTKLFVSSGSLPVVFTESAQAAGLDDPFWGSSLVAVDYDRDGDLDLIQNCNVNGSEPSVIRVMKSQLRDVPAGKNYLVVKPRTAGSNRRAIGAVVRATVGSVEMMRLITAGTSFFGQEPAEAFFGLGSATVVDQVTVEWPDGTTTQQSNVAINQVLTIQAAVDTDGDGTPDSIDPDDDDDGRDDGLDCAPLDDRFWETPGPVSSVDVIHTGAIAGTTTFSWSAPAASGGTSVWYDFLVSGSPTGFDGAATCNESADGADTQATDATVLAGGERLYFLARPGNGCGAGDPGSGTAGPRTLQSCP